MTLDIQIELQRQAIVRLNNEAANLKSQHIETQDRLKTLEDAIHSITTTVDILSLAMAEQYEQALAIADQQITTMGAIAEVYEEIMIYDEPPGGGEING